MLDIGTRIEMTKGYKGITGTLIGVTDSPYEFYIIELDNGVNLVAGPSAFVMAQKAP